MKKVIIFIKNEEERQNVINNFTKKFPDMEIEVLIDTPDNRKAIEQMGLEMPVPIPDMEELKEQVNKFHIDNAAIHGLTNYKKPLYKDNIPFYKKFIK